MERHRTPSLVNDVRDEVMGITERKAGRDERGRLKARSESRSFADKVRDCITLVCVIITAVSALVLMFVGLGLL